jgi:hypothetical protein
MKTITLIRFREAFCFSSFKMGVKCKPLPPFVLIFSPNTPQSFQMISPSRNFSFNFVDWPFLNDELGMMNDELGLGNREW